MCKERKYPKRWDMVEDVRVTEFWRGGETQNEMLHCFTFGLHFG